MASRLQYDASSAIRAADERSLPLLGVKIEALQRLAADARFDDDTTTEAACQQGRRDAGELDGPGLARGRHGLQLAPVPVRRHGRGAGRALPGTRSVAEVLRATDPASVGKSNRFICQAWNLRFRRVVAAVARQVEKERAAGVTEEIYLWFDVISIDEHHAGDYAKGFCTTFVEAIKEIGHFYLAAGPWDAPVVLTRIWCLWDLYCCQLAGATLSVCLSEADEDAFVAALVADGVDAALIPFSKIDCKRAQATNKEDLEKISREIERTIGFGKLDATVVEQLRNSVGHGGGAAGGGARGGQLGRAGAAAAAAARGAADRAGSGCRGSGGVHRGAAGGGRAGVRDEERLFDWRVSAGCSASPAS